MSVADETTIQVKNQHVDDRDSIEYSNEKNEIISSHCPTANYATKSNNISNDSYKYKYSQAFIKQLGNVKIYPLTVAWIVDAQRIFPKRKSFSNRYHAN